MKCRYDASSSDIPCDSDIETSTINLLLTITQPCKGWGAENTQVCLFGVISLAENPQFQQKSMRGRDSSVGFLFPGNYLKNQRILFN